MGGWRVEYTGVLTLISSVALLGWYFYKVSLLMCIRVSNIVLI